MGAGYSLYDPCLHLEDKSEQFRREEEKSSNEDKPRDKYKKNFDEPKSLC